MLKVIVIGSPGAGKSTFSRKLRDITNLPLYYLDMLWHKPDKTNISREEFNTKLNEIIKKEQWIIDFPKKQLPQIYKLLNQYHNNKTIITFHSRKEADTYFNTMLYKNRIE